MPPERENITSQIMLVQHLIKEENWEVLEENKISDDDFQGFAKEGLEYVRNYYNEYEEFPSIDLMQEDINFPARTKLDPFDKVIKSFKNFRLKFKLNTIVNSAKKSLRDNEPQKCRSQLITDLDKLEVNSQSQIIRVKEDASKRVEQYNTERNTERTGIIPPFKSLQDAIGVWEKDAIHSIIAVSSSGKSWISCYSAVHAAFMQGKNVLLVTRENSPESMTKRCDSLQFKLPYQYFRDYTLDIRTIPIWEKKIQELQEKKGEIYIAGSKEAKTIDDIYTLATAKKPDFIIIDAVYKMSAATYEASSKVLQDAEDMTQAVGSSLLVTAQLKPNANSGLSGRDLGMAARGNSDFFLNSCTQLAITQSEDLRMKNRIQCEVTKEREAGSKSGVGTKFILSFDMTKMEIGEVEGYEDDEVLQDAL